LAERLDVQSHMTHQWLTSAVLSHAGILQETHHAALQDSVQQAVAGAVSSRDADLLALHQQLDESEAHFQAELDEAHAQLLDSQEIQLRLEQQLRDSEAKR